MKKRLLSVPYIDQTLLWPTGCESVSTVMLLQYLGFSVSVDDFVRLLPKYPLQNLQETWVGADPNQHFIGSPEDPDAFGCYAPVICRTLEKFISENGGNYRAENVSGMPTDELLRRYIDRKMPVIYWATIDLKESIPGPSWRLYTPDGPEFLWRSNEHCMLLTGYDEEYLYFNDPWHNHGVIAYEKQLAIARHEEMYSMAVSLSSPGE